MSEYPTQNWPDEWQGGGTDRRRNPGRVKELEAQLAAEREQGVKVLAERSFELHECRQQLAAERHKLAILAGQLDLTEKQLAAERENSKMKTENVYKLIAEKTELRQQLAAERGERQLTSELRKVDQGTIKMLREQLKELEEELSKKYQI